MVTQTQEYIETGEADAHAFLEKKKKKKEIRNIGPRPPRRSFD